MTFVQSGGRRYINTAAVKEVSRIKKDEWSTQLTWLDGTIEEVDGRPERFYSASRPVIRAEPNFATIHFSFFFDDDEDPKTYDIKAGLYREPIIAWRIEDDGYPTPITPSGACNFDDSHGLTGVMWPDGRVEIPFDRTCRDVQSFVEAIRGEWIAYREREAEQARRDEEARVKAAQKDAAP